MKTIKCKAAIAWKPKQPLDVTQIQVAPPKQGEVRVKVLSNALCHTDIYTLQGNDAQGLFPCILGHEATAIVQSVGQGVKSLKEGDMVIPCYTPQCREYNCIFCNSNKTNLCPKIRSTQGKGVMPDGTSRFSKDGKQIYHFMGCSTFSQYTVIAQISAAKINPRLNPSFGALLGCGVSTGWGAAFNTCKVTTGQSVVVFGLGAVGLSVIQMASKQGASTIIGVDINQAKFSIAKQFGATQCVGGGQSVKQILLQKNKWGYDFTFDCTGVVQVMRIALEVAHRGWGESCVIGVAASGHQISTKPFQLVTGRVWKGTAFGGWKARTQVPKLANRCLVKQLEVQKYITHNIKGLQNVNDSIKALYSGQCLRAVVQINKFETVNKQQLVIIQKDKVGSGILYKIKHFSVTLNCQMKFNIYLPGDWMDRINPYPTLYYLSGLSCNEDNAAQKSNFQSAMKDIRMAIVFPDTSPRLKQFPIKGNWRIGQSAGHYVDATSPQWSSFQMFSYINKELINLIQDFFPVDPKRKSIMGHSMGGHGALISYFKNPVFKSVSCLAPNCHPYISGISKQAFKAYFKNQQQAKQWDSTLIISNMKDFKGKIMIDQGTNDQFKSQLKVDEFEKIAKSKGFDITINWRQGFGHNYYFVSSFISNHISYHAQILNAQKINE